jgi:ferrous iron transport protein B
MSPAAALALLVVQMLFIPCIATVATIKQESGTKWTAISLAMLLVITLGAGILAYRLGTLLIGV